MRKSAAILAVLATIVSLTACGASGSSAQTTPTAAPTEAPTETAVPTPESADEPAEAATEVPAAPEATDEPASSSNILIAYFSRVGNMNYEEGVDAVTSASVNLEEDGIAGNTELLAYMAQEATGGDLFFIETVEKYPVQYRATTDQAKTEQNNAVRPELASHVENMDAYDTVILIYPNWWGDLPMAVFTFLEEYDFSGKTILPLCTHEGSGLSRTESTIADLFPEATVLDGLSVRGGNAASAQADVANWITSSGILS